MVGEDGAYQLATTHQFSDDVSPGESYKLRVRAHNLLGWGDWSGTTIILSTGVPDQPAQPVTAISNIFVRITWTDPDHNFEAIDAYRILLRHSNGSSYSEELEHCDGSNQIIFLRKYCEVPVSAFTSVDFPFQLVAGSNVIAKVAAHNQNGWSDYSEPNTVGAQIETVPFKLDAPTRDPTTTTFQIVVDWLPPSNDGYSEIISYNLQWDSGTDGATWTNLIGYNTESLAMTFTVASSLT